MHFRPVNEAMAALPGTELPERNCDDCWALSGSCSSCCPGEVTSKSFLHFSVNQEKMEREPEAGWSQFLRRCEPVDPGPGPPAGPGGLSRTVGGVQATAEGLGRMWRLLDSRFSMCCWCARERGPRAAWKALRPVATGCPTLSLKHSLGECGLHASRADTNTLGGTDKGAC